MAHIDVVPEGDLYLWDTNPWEAVVKDGKIYGRGTEDNQQGLVSSVFTLRAFIEGNIIWRSSWLRMKKPARTMAWGIS